MPHTSVEFCRYDRLQERAAAFLREWGAQGEVLVVGASRPAVDDLIRSVCDTALIAIRRCTLRDLVASLADPFLIANDVAPARQIAREALAASVARRAELNYLKDVARFPGFARALARTLQDLSSVATQSREGFDHRA